MSVNTDQIVVSDKFNHNNDSRYFIGYQEGEIVIIYYFTSNDWVYKLL